MIPVSVTALILNNIQDTFRGQDQFARISETIMP
jgi:hypothetical protein